MTKHLLIIFCLFSLGMALQAQQAIIASGNGGSASGASVSYSVGQIVYTTNTGTNGSSVAQGVQQPYEISVVNGIVETQSITLLCSAYPNPVKDQLTLKVDASTLLQSTYYQLYDISGKLLMTKRIADNETSIIMNNLVAAIYFLKVTQNNKLIKTFKIIKN